MLKDKTALITGSLGGIGFATAKALAGTIYVHSSIDHIWS